MAGGEGGGGQSNRHRRRARLTDPVIYDVGRQCMGLAVNCRVKYVLPWLLPRSLQSLCPAQQSGG